MLKLYLKVENFKIMITDIFGADPFLLYSKLVLNPTTNFGLRCLLVPKSCRDGFYAVAYWTTSTRATWIKVKVD